MTQNSHHIAVLPCADLNILCPVQILEGRSIYRLTGDISYWYFQFCVLFEYWRRDQFIDWQDISKLILPIAILCFICWSFIFLLRSFNISFSLISNVGLLWLLGTLLALIGARWPLGQPSDTYILLNHGKAMSLAFELKPYASGEMDSWKWHASKLCACRILEMYVLSCCQGLISGGCQQVVWASNGLTWCLKAVKRHNSMWDWGMVTRWECIDLAEACRCSFMAC